MSSLDGDTGNEDPVKEEPASTTPVATSKEETEADDRLVNEAYDKISGIIVKHITKGMEDVGEYLLKTFYDDDIYKALDKKPTKKKSLNKLIIKLKEEKQGSPSRSWIYNSIKIVVDKHYFEEKKVEEYKQLQPSHRVYLTHVNDLEKKEKLVIETAKHGYTIAKLKERIKEEHTDGYVFPPLSVLEQTKANFSEWPIDKLKDFYKKIESNIKSLEDRLEKHAQKKEELDALIDSKKKESAEE